MMDEEEWEAEAPAFRVRPIDFLILGLGYLKDVVDANSKLLEQTQYLMIGAANREKHQLDFVEDARLQIEQITQEQETPEDG